jgi:hypothetical protein
MSAVIYYLFSGDRSTIEELYPHFVKFDRFLATHVDKDGLLPVQGWTWNYVWLEHFGWKAEIDKYAAWNIYYAGYLKEGIARLADWLGDRQTAIEAWARAGLVAERVRERYWSEGLELFVDNLPRIESDKEVRLHDRTLSMALLFDVVPMGKESKAVELLAGLPTRRFGPIFRLDAPKAEIGFSYPPNVCWRLWALSRFGRGDAVVRDLRERWSNLKSLLMNNTFAESWEPRATETGDVWCQNGPVVLNVLYGDVLGIRPNAPEFGQFDVRPQIGDLDWIQGTVYAPSGAIRLRCERQGPGLSLSLTVPANLQAGLVFPRGTELRGLPAETRSEPGPAPDTSRWRLPSSPKVQLWEIQAVRPS